MKTRFNSYDIVCGVAELQRFIGFRVNQIYDIDNKTYLFRLHGGGAAEKITLLFESGIRFHTTAFDWPKSVAPSGFTMKLRKHLKNKRLERISQLGSDRIIDFQFGIEDAAHHVFLELYDRGNIILTDCDMTILYILRPHTENETLKFAVREKYPVSRGKIGNDEFSEKKMRDILQRSSKAESLKRLLIPILDCGPAVIEHVLTENGLENYILKGVEDTDLKKELSNNQCKKKKKSNHTILKDYQKVFDLASDLPTLMKAVKSTRELMTVGQNGNSKGFIIQVKEEKPTTSENTEHFYRNIEFHPYLFSQFAGLPFKEYDTFLEAVDEFYSSQESQKIDLKTFQQEREAIKKLDNVKNDHSKRLEELNKLQDEDKKKAELITSNQSLVDKAILAIQSAIASQLPWPDIQELVKEAQSNGDKVAIAIKQLKLEKNHISLLLSDPYKETEYSSNCNVDDNDLSVVDVDLALSAWANACRYYDSKRFAALKEKKTIDASQKALKSAERKTQQTLKEVRTISNIAKARKVFWFEKFFWFVSSENYLVIGGRDAQQNELIVKKYMRSKDIYVHADIQGASSVVIRNTTESDIPPKTLLEAGTMAISYSVAWDAKVVTNVYWVHSDQVSKTAPTGEYLGTGSFMIRGKKNFLPSCHLTMGLSLLFKLEEGFVQRHEGERKFRATEEFNDTDELIRHEITYKEIKDISEVSESSSEITNNVFPNTEIKIEHDTGKITVKSDILVDKIIPKVSELEPIKTIHEEDAVIIKPGPSRKKTQIKKRKESKEFFERENNQNQQCSDVEPINPSKIKRGQKAKLKKMKEKYGDQDEEERKLRMMILNSSGKDKQKENNGKDGKIPDTVQTKNKAESLKPVFSKNPCELEESEEVSVTLDTELLNTLTGVPFDDDELLFAIPVVAPYQALQQYKFKVKLTPGTGKRGKAAKLALGMFAKEKSCNSRQKDLLKSIKEEALARNIPGKVKISAPQLQKLRK